MMGIERPMSTSTDAGARPGAFPRPIPADDLTEAARQFLSHAGPRFLVANAAALWALRLSDRRVDATDVATAAGVVVWWPIQEWVAHRYVLHAPPRRIAGRRVDLAVARHHRKHHADPWNPEHTLLPTWFLAIAGPVHAGAWVLATRDRRRAIHGMACFATATVVYEWVHFLTHTAHRPRRSWFRTLQRRHRLHHFKDEHLWLGFTVPYVDDLLGTAPDPATVPVSETVRTLGVVDQP
jgi:hypothetical protein